MTEPTLPPPNGSGSSIFSPLPTIGRFEHHGRVGELFPITLANLFYKAITLGIYHFWGKTRVRRYLWGRTTFEGDALEYTGEGIELFKGLLFSLKWLLPPILFFVMIIVFFIIGLVSKDSLLLPFIFVLFIYGYVIFLMGYGRYSARKYMFGHTRWRGIRLGLSGSAKDHALKGLRYTFLTAITLGIYTPFMRNHLAANFINHTWIGDRKLHYPTGKGIAVGFVGRFWGMVAMGAAYTFIRDLAYQKTVQGLADYFIRTMDASDKSIIFMFQALVIFLAALYYIPFAMIWFWYRAGEIRIFIDNTEIEGAHLQTNFDTGPFVWLRITNIAAVLVTLGLAFPWAAVRTARFFSNHIRIVGTLDLSSIGQSSEEVLREGEGLAEVFDLGII